MSRVRVSGLRLRAATAEDFDTVTDIHSASVRGLGSTHYGPEEIELWSAPPDQEGFLESLETGEVYVAEQAGRACGYGRVLPATGEIQAVYVHPDHVRRGIGATILSHLEERAREAGALRLRLRASLNAETFYVEAGWRAVERTTHMTRGGVELACVWMEKEVEPMDD